MSAFAGIAGHSTVRALLQSQLQAERLPHAYLFVGEPGLGKTLTARALAAALLPERELGLHPDFWEDDRQGNLKLDEIRLIPDKAPEFHDQTLQGFLSLKPALSSRRVALITNVGRIPDQTQGILLKTLEEPHPGQVLILTTPSVSPFVVLPTVVSRCQRVSFHPVPLHEVEQLLLERGVDDERAALLAQLSRGRPGWALGAALDDTVLERHQHWSARLAELFGGPADAALGLAAEVDAANFGWRGGDRSGEDPAVFAVSSWQLLLRERMIADLRTARGTWARLLELSYDTLGYLEQNVSPRLALECFLLEARHAA